MHHATDRSMAIQTIRAWIDFLANPAPRHVRQMGYVRELRALRARQRRCRTDWQPHLDHTRAVVLESAAQCVQRRSALVVGSGLLFDVPLEELSRQFGRVVLVDIAHLWSVHRRADRLANVHLMPLDVTGVVERCHAMARERSEESLPQRPVDCFAGESFDLVVSLNVLSQLPVVPNGYLSRHLRSVADAHIRAFSRALVINHLDWLCSFPGIACLVTDLERQHVDDCRTVSAEESLWGITLPDGGRTWLWDLAPRPEMYFDVDVRHRVVGYSNFPKHAWLTTRDRSHGRRASNGAQS